MHRLAGSFIKSVCAPGLGSGVQSKSCESGVEGFARLSSTLW